jgi:hypothetical protein
MRARVRAARGSGFRAPTSRSCAPAATPMRSMATRSRRCCASRLRGREAVRALPPYDRAALAREMALMPEWFCARHLRTDTGGVRGAARALRVPDRRGAGAADRVRAPRFPFAQPHGAAAAQSGRHRFSGRAGRALRLRPGVAAQGLLHRLAARAGGAWVAAIARSSIAAGGDGGAMRRVPALVRSDRPAAAHQGTRYLCAPVVSRRQERLPRRSAAHARIRARCGAALQAAAHAFSRWVERAWCRVRRGQRARWPRR